jgi:peptidoglycan hydrolase CwlO-like protein/surface antigen
MKLRTTTPDSKSFFSKLLLVLTVLVISFVAPLQYMNKQASADKYDDQISALQQQINNYNAQAGQLNAQALTLQNALAQLASEKAVLQTQINLSQAKYDQLTAQIADTEKKIQDNKDALGITIASLYVDGSVSPIEMLASSKNISDYLDKQQYQNSVRDQLTSTIKTIKDLKTKLDTQKSDVENVLATQKSARDTLVTKEKDQADLLAQTQGQESNYQSLISSNTTQIASARAAQAVIRARANSTGGYTLVDAGSLPGYPWNSSNCPMSYYFSTGGVQNPDGTYSGLDGRGYGCRQCVSYVAYRVAKATGVYYEDLGNGGDTAQNLVSKHHWTNLNGTPQAGSVASLWGNPGHTAYVEAVSADGSKVLVTQYNYDYGTGFGMYSEMWLSTSFFNQYAKS